MPTIVTSILEINAKRFLSDFDELSAIGMTGNGGVNRPALSEEYRRARAWFIEKAKAVGLETLVDKAGNHSAVFRSSHPDAKTLLIGSHTDSVPHGGRFDGALGVVAALEVVRRLKEDGIGLSVNVEAIDFTDEEGQFVGLLGSRAFTGKLRPEDLAEGHEFQAALDTCGLSREGLLSAKRPSELFTGYLELHIEQGAVLEKAGLDIGVVSGIVGIHTCQLKFQGAANHAGTTPMNQRRDALLGASAFIVAAHELVRRDFPDCVCNVGIIRVLPGASNVIPGTAEISLESRSIDKEKLHALETTLLRLAAKTAQPYDLASSSSSPERLKPALLSPRSIDAISSAAKGLGLTYRVMPSGAGHDAECFADICDTGMIFIPSKDGISHSPHEYSSPEHCIAGANVLFNAALGMAGSA